MEVLIRDLDTGEEKLVDPREYRTHKREVAIFEDEDGQEAELDWEEFREMDWAGDGDDDEEDE